MGAYLAQDAEPCLSFFCGPATPQASLASRPPGGFGPLVLC